MEDESDVEAEGESDAASYAEFIEDTTETSDGEGNASIVIKPDQQWDMDIAEEITLAEIELLSEPKVEGKVDDNYDEAPEKESPVEPDDDISRPYKCDHCEKAFASMSSLRTHNYIHNQGHFECPFCPNKVLTNAGFLRVHMRKAHNIFTSKEDRQTNGSTTRPLKNLRECLCDICNRYFTKIGIITHMKSHLNSKGTLTADGNKVIKCPLCLLTFSCRKNVHRHMKNIHSDEKQNHPANFVCHLCPESFQIVVQLYEHFKTHDDTCQETVEGFDLHCEECQTRFDTYEGYAKHVVDQHNHSKVKPYKCRFCATRHGTRVALYMHINSHYETSPWRAPKLVKTPKKRSSVNQRFLCPTCGNDFCTKQILKQHMLIHSGEKPHQCSYCQKKFRNTSSLKEHIRVHTDERPYECQSCSKAFRSHANLRNHRISAHSTVKKHSCHVCSKSFKFKANLRYAGIRSIFLITDNIILLTRIFFFFNQ